MSLQVSTHALPISSLVSAALNTEQTTVLMPEGSLSAYFITQLAHKQPRRMLILTPTPEEAVTLHHELQFYGCPNPILLPPWNSALFTTNNESTDECIFERVTALFELQSHKSVLVTAIGTALQLLPPHDVFSGASLQLVVGTEIQYDHIAEELVQRGYSHVDLVDEPGTFALRGSILDIFPAHHQLPARIDLFGDEIESIRTFDPITQRSCAELLELTLLPSRELVIPASRMAPLLSQIKQRADELDIPADRRRAFAEQIQAADTSLRFESLGPFIYEQLETIFRYQPDPYIVWYASERCKEEAHSWYLTVSSQYQAAISDHQILLPLNRSILSPDQFWEYCRVLPSTAFCESLASTSPARITGSNTADCKIPTHGEHSHQFSPFAEKVTNWLHSGTRVCIGYHNPSQAERLTSLFEASSVSCRHCTSFQEVVQQPPDAVALTAGDITRGFKCEEEQLVVIAEEELFGARSRRKSGSSALRKKQILASLAELRPGDPMVHIDHGVGIYRGLQHLRTGGHAGDFLLLEYAGNDKLYLPIDRIGLVQRYSGGDGANPPPARLGTASWQKIKTKAKTNIEELALELLQVYAKRQASSGYQFSPPDALYREFEATFPWEETPDQFSAINDVLHDMQHERPMDRLVCGDVGYGKTEVAIRAAFKAVLDGKQVAVLVPTTILAQQHFETFKTRMEGYPVTIEALSRFRTAKEQKTILEQVETGRIDIVIGTQRLLQKDVRFKDLGLLIVDEEQRFGVKDKERLKQFRASVDILTLTATPIPRTLHLAMLGIRDLSIIDTPPVDRHAIKTIVMRDDDELLTKAIAAELERGGQVFYVHNRVQSIGRAAERVKALAPTASVQVAHGQMDERQLEKIMLSFMHGETDILVTTTIIESGLDIPRANTMIVERADQFGLSQLYQLRGRIGRSKVQSIAYLLVPGLTRISSDARERLRILQDISELGAGFRIASHDLELRGAGDMLGPRQSGTVADIGFELYTQMLDEAITELKGTPIEEHWEPEISVPIPAFLPETFISNMNQRLVMYKRLVQTESLDEIDELLAELKDRYGELPTPVRNLKAIMLLRLVMRKLKIGKLDLRGPLITVSFRPDTTVTPELIIEKIRRSPNIYSFTPEHQLRIQMTPGLTDTETLALLRQELEGLSPLAA